jgi:hypothetical protein
MAGKQAKQSQAIAAIKKNMTLNFFPRCALNCKAD